MLSKEKYTQFPYVLKAQQKLKEIGYDYYDWVKPGLECGIDSSPAADELMLNLLSRQPLWSDYNPETINT